MLITILLLDAVLVELLVVIVILMVLSAILIGIYESLITTYSIQDIGSWPSANPFTAVGPTPFAISYTVTRWEIITRNPPFGAPKRKKNPLPLEPDTKVKFDLIGSNGANLITGSKSYTMVVDSSGKADIKIIALNNAGDELQATIIVNGISAIDSNTIRFETHNP